MKIIKHQEEIILDILSGESYTDIAKKYGLSTKTIYRLRQKEDFQNLVKEQKKKCFESALNKASYLSNTAIDELKKIIITDDVTAQNKIQACKIILELAKNNYETENIVERIEELERLARGEK